jgi:hypothetical protein
VAVYHALNHHVGLCLAGLVTVQVLPQPGYFHSVSFRPSAARAGIQIALAITTCVSDNIELDFCIPGD